MNCTEKRTKYQPTVEEYVCPKCNGSDFVIEDSACENTIDGDLCGFLHDNDILRCYSCMRYFTGRAFAAALVRKNNLIQCPCCKGKGFVENK